MKQTAIGYVRVSTEAQASDGVSLEAQRARIESWASANGIKLLAIHVDAGISGAKAANRPALQKALAQATKGKAALVAYSLSRVARSTRDALDIAAKLERAGADLVSLTENVDTRSAAGKMVFRMLAVLAEFERDLVSERTRGALAHIRAQGRRISGRIPYGYTLDGDRLIPNAVEQATLHDVRTRRTAGETLEGIARSLTEAGVPGKMNGAWTATTVRRLVARPA